MFYKDDPNSFFFDCYPTFALGVSPNHEFRRGRGQASPARIDGNPELAIHIGEQMISDEFDLTSIRSARSTTAAIRRFP